MDYSCTKSLFQQQSAMYQMGEDREAYQTAIWTTSSGKGSVLLRGASIQWNDGIKTEN